VLGIGGRRGQTLTEFALVAPVFFVLVLGLVDMSRAVYYYNVISNAAREGAREAILQYNQCSNQAPGITVGSKICPTPPSGTGVSIVGVRPAMNRVTGGALAFTFLNTTTDTGTAPACTHLDANGNTVSGPAPNAGCVWVFVVGSGTTCLPGNGPGPTDAYSLCNHNSLKASGHYDITVEIEYSFMPYTPLLSNLMGNGTTLWAKSEMRAEY
jgi:Flp pilus assembly protein TadG